MTDLSTKLAEWKADKLRGPVPPALLGRLERAHKAKEENIRGSRTMTEESKRLEINEARREFRIHWNRMRGQIIEQYDAEVETARRTANPPASDEQLQRMNLLSGIHVRRWERAAGNLVADAVEFEQQGDEAGLRLARQHVGVLDPSQRSSVAATIDEALSDLRTDAQRAAAAKVGTLEQERDQFANGTVMRQHFIRESTRSIGSPASRARAPIAGAPQPQR